MAPRAIAAYLPQFLLELRGLDLAAELVSVEGSDGAGIVMACTAAAGRRAVRPGMTVAQAVQGCPTLQGVRHDGAAEARALLALQEKLHGLWPAANVRAISGPFLVLDAPTGGALSAVACSPEREHAMASELVEVLRRLGHVACAAVAASGPAAMALAQGTWPRQDGDVVVVPLGHTAHALAPLPVRALPGIAPELVEALGTRGVRTCGALAALPQSAVVALAPALRLPWMVARSEHDQPEQGLRFPNGLLDWRSVGEPLVAAGAPQAGEGGGVGGNVALGRRGLDNVIDLAAHRARRGGVG